MTLTTGHLAAAVGFLAALAGGTSASETPAHPSRDPYAGDPYADDLTYRAALEQALSLIETEALRDSGRLKVRDLIDAYPASPRLRYERGCHLAQASQWDRAVTEWEEALFADGGKSVVSVRSLEGIAAAESRRGRRNASRRALEQLAKTSPLSYAVWERLARGREQDGDVAGAKRARERALQLRPAGGTVRSRSTGRPPDLPSLLRRMRRSVVLIRNGDDHVTGFVAFEPGIILTAAHGTEGRSSRVDVISFGDGSEQKTLSGTVVCRDAARDLALIHCPGLPDTAKPVTIATTDGMETGTRLFTVGHPGLGKSTLTLTPSEGILAATNREIDGRKLIQCSMAVNPGNSGGPLFESGGRVVGILVQRAVLEGVCFAVPVREASEMLADPGPLHPPPGGDR